MARKSLAVHVRRLSHDPPKSYEELPATLVVDALRRSRRVTRRALVLSSLIATIVAIVFLPLGGWVGALVAYASGLGGGYGFGRLYARREERKERHAVVSAR